MTVLVGEQEKDLLSRPGQDLRLLVLLELELGQEPPGLFEPFGPLDSLAAQMLLSLVRSLISAWKFWDVLWLVQLEGD